MNAFKKLVLRAALMTACLSVVSCGQEPVGDKKEKSELAALSSQDIACLSGVGSAAAWAKSCGPSSACYVGAALGGVATLIGCYDKTKINFYQSCSCITNSNSQVLENEMDHITFKGKLYCPNQPIGIPFDCKAIFDTRG